MPRDAVAPATGHASALLSPFDPLIWFRPRTQRLFQFDYRFEIFVPQAKRRWGSYVLPFLCGDRLVARVDAKVHREQGRLQIPGAWLEPGADAGLVVRALASWLGLETVRVGRRGDLARRLSAALTA